MHQPPHGESIFGDIISAFKIAMDIYMIIAEDENGMEQTGVLARKSTAKKNLSQKAVSMAEQDGEWLCYDENNKDIIIYEVLQHQVAVCKKIETAALNEMAEIRRDGKLFLTDYFGECAPPFATQHGEVKRMFKVRNGIFFTQDNKEMQFAVHEAVADNYMSSIASEFGKRKGDYLFYDITTSIIPLNELKNVFEEAREVLVSEENLYTILDEKFPVYTILYHEIMKEEYT